MLPDGSSDTSERYGTLRSLTVSKIAPSYLLLVVSRQHSDPNSSAIGTGECITASKFLGGLPGEQRSQSGSRRSGTVPRDGEDVLAELSEKTGLSRLEILGRLSRDLPRAVDNLTPGVLCRRQSSLATSALSTRRRLRCRMLRGASNPLPCRRRVCSVAVFPSSPSSGASRLRAA